MATTIRFNVDAMVDDKICVKQLNGDEKGDNVVVVDVDETGAVTNTRRETASVTAQVAAAAAQVADEMEAEPHPTVDDGARKFILELPILLEKNSKYKENITIFNYIIGIYKAGSLENFLDNNNTVTDTIDDDDSHTILHKYVSTVKKLFEMYDDNNKDKEKYTNTIMDAIQNINNFHGGFSMKLITDKLFGSKKTKKHYRRVVKKSFKKHRSVRKSRGSIRRHNRFGKKSRYVRSIKRK